MRTPSRITPRSEPPTPRRRDAAGSRQAIEDAATVLFATRGYALAGVRDIAAQAGVNSALVGRYFGSKETLFRTIVVRALDMGPVLAGPRDGFGAHVAMIFRETEAKAIRSPLAMMLLSMGDREARAIASDLIEQQIIVPLASWLGPPDARTRARALNMLWSGYLTHAQLLPNGSPGAERALEQWLAETTQALVDNRTVAPCAAGV